MYASKIFKEQYFTQFSKKNGVGLFTYDDELWQWQGQGGCTLASLRRPKDRRVYWRYSGILQKMKQESSLDSRSMYEYFSSERKPTCTRTGIGSLD